ncbi:MAG TPA: GNAT family N-acetyltransferase [Mucilaginibacter sp.]|nr:GNAT family N-acetyltransferase [Mucilaginibacter sp.]
MPHLLDNPAWNAYRSGNKDLATGNEQALYLPLDISPFAGMKENSAEDFEQLHNISPGNAAFGVITPDTLNVPAGWTILNRMEVLQMTNEVKPSERRIDNELVALGGEHVPAMLALTKLTNPGPFSARTIEFGHYRGIFEGSELIAMAGQRLNPTPYAEISAVCTHPDHTGKGYAADLMSYQINRIKAAGGIPFLHVLRTNERAIGLYRSLGFTGRSELYVYVIKKG